MKIFKFFITLLPVFLAGCVPIYNVSYIYKPPTANAGNICIAQCSQNKNQCTIADKITHETCLNRAHQDAQQEFAGYQAEQIKHNQPIKKSVSDFDKGWSTCDNNANNNCNAEYNLCYQTCGGQIIENRVCTAFCDKA